MWFIRIIFIEKNSKKKIAKKIYIYEKSKSNIAKIKKLKLPGIISKKIRRWCYKIRFNYFMHTNE